MPASSLLPDDGRPLHVRIKEWMLRQIETYPLDAQLPSDRVLARQLGASFLTVNKVMVELAREGYVVRRPGRGTFLASRERRVLSGAESRSPGEVVFAHPAYFSYGFWTRVRLAEELALKKGLGFVEFKMNRDTTYDGLIETVRSRDRVRGVLVLPVPGSVTDQVASALDGLGVPVVVLALCDWGPPRGNLYQVAADFFADGHLKIRHLAERGHRSIGYVRNEPDSPERAFVWRGMRQALRDCGLPLGSIKRTAAPTRPWEDATEAGRRLAREFLARHKVTALAFDSLAGAVGAMRALWDMGLRVPEDVSLIATGDGQNREEYMTPPLTTVCSDAAAEIAAAFDIILGVSRPGDHRTLIKVSLVERMSVATLGEARRGAVAPRATAARREDST